MHYPIIFLIYIYYIFITNNIPYIFLFVSWTAATRPRLSG
jgi:hypothetical protein